MFIFERETEHEQGRGRKRGRQRIWNRLQALSCQHRAQRGAQTHGPQDHDLSQSRPLNRLSHPGAPHSYVYNSIIYNSWIMEATQVSINRWTEREDVVYIHNGILLSHKKWNLAICNNMDGTREYNVKQDKSNRERHIPYVFTHMWNLRNKTNKQREKEERKINQETDSYL